MNNGEKFSLKKKQCSMLNYFDQSKKSEFSEEKRKLSQSRILSHDSSTSNESFAIDISSSSEAETKESPSAIKMYSNSKHNAMNNNEISPKKSSDEKKAKSKIKLKPINIDGSLNDWIENMQSQLGNISSSKDNIIELEKSIAMCNDFYVDVLERITQGFENIPLEILEKFPKFSSTTYMKLKSLKQRLKATIKLKKSFTEKLKSPTQKHIIKDNTTEARHSNSPSDSFTRIMKVTNSDEEDDLSDFEVTKYRSPLGKSKLPPNLVTSNSPSLLDKSGIFSVSDYESPERGRHEVKSNAFGLSLNRQFETDSTEKPNRFCTFNDIRDDSLDKIDKTTTNEPNNINYDNSEKKKGSFVFKKPSRLSTTGDGSILCLDSPVSTTRSNILERTESAVRCLKPIATPEIVKPTVKPLDSSVPFQPPKRDILDCMSTGQFDNMDVDSDEDNLSSVLNEPNLECDFSFANSNLSSEKRQSIVAIGDDDDWPEYKPEDFEDVVPKNDDVVCVGSSEPMQSDRANMGNFYSNVKNDGITGEFDGMDYPHCFELMAQFKEKFGLKSFRPNQLQVINATLLRNDCFVLMPTGGGKSLCYQLPAILTPGVTIVISPLKSLILDQVHKLNSLDIPAAHMSGNVSMSRMDEIYHQLAYKEPSIKLLYVTPEKISASQKFQATLDSLYSRDKLARFVIDEAHCVSQWGHDFRPDYKKLSLFRQRFPRVPIIALTATAAPRVRLDILHQLGIPNCKWFLCSFNRPNLKYSVLPKKGATIIADIEEIIKKKFLKQSGIIYCLSRKECDSVAAELRKLGISAGSYHAGLTDHQREMVQTNWIDDKFRVVCATIAFGMGIDKADVRFVIHHSLPKSIEGYYQEAGRAGRDGEEATCIIFYSYTDVMRYRKLLDLDPSANYEAKKIHITNLMRMVDFCENVTECRRAQVLAYFAETFNREQCRATSATTCDNCLKTDDYKVVDVTEDCQAICRCVRDLCSGRNRFTMLHISEVFKGSLQKKIVDNQHQKHPLHGRGKNWPKGDGQRLLHQLITKEFLMEEMIVSNDIANAYIRLGPQVHRLMNGEVKILFPLKSSKKTLNMAVGGAAKANEVPMNAELKLIQEKCYNALLETCRKIAHEKNVTLASIMNLQALKAMAIKLPETPDEMMSLPHVTKANFEKYGKELLEVTVIYSAEKLAILMEMQDKEEAKKHSNVDYSSDTDWTNVASGASTSTSKISGGKRKNSYYGNKAKRFKRGNKSKNTSAKFASLKKFKQKVDTGATKSTPKSKTSTSRIQTVSSLGCMPIPKTNKTLPSARSTFLPPLKVRSNLNL